MTPAGARHIVVAGCLLVFIPAVGEFVIPSLLGDPGMLMIGKVLWTEFFNNRDWPVASAVAPSLKVTVPVGVPLPGGTGLTPAAKITGWPNTVELVEDLGRRHPGPACDVAALGKAQ